ncbi:MAG TPA: exodeoxyribonuclease VII small subunit [Chthoniobacterales bacterium]|jgi:exodeoxyribonuclease VII small subunit
MSAATKKTASELNFEAAMDRLEAIVDEMESGKLMLEDLIVRYEEGMKLVTVCGQRLTSAEQRIQIITRDHAGKPVLKDFEAKSSAAQPSAPEKGETNNDDVSLF